MLTKLKPASNKTKELMVRIILLLRIFAQISSIEHSSISNFWGEFVKILQP